MLEQNVMYNFIICFYFEFSFTLNKYIFNQSIMRMILKAKYHFFATFME